MSSFRYLLPAVLIACAHPAIAAPAHVHGQAKLDVAVQGGEVSLHLDSPLDNLLGFEHAPRSNQQVEAARQMVAKLRAMGSTFILTSAADCAPTNVVLQSAALDPNLLSGSKKNPVGKATAKAMPTDSHHADLDADYNFQCNKPALLHDLDVRLFESFPRLQGIEVQLAVPKGQSAARLSPTAHSLSW